MPDHHLDLTIRAQAGHARRVLVSKDNYDYMTIFYNRNSQNYDAIINAQIGKK